MSANSNSSDQSNKQWTQQQIKLLQSLRSVNKLKKWKIISNSLSKKGFKKSQQQCRHKWVNCLNPQIDHTPFKDEELRILYEQYQKYFSQWSIIQRSLPNRTQIKIKNQFYGLIRNILRYVLKFFKKHVGRQTQISNKISPNVLKLIYCGKQKYSFLDDQIRNRIREMNYRLDKQKLTKIISENRQLYQKFNKKILKQINLQNQTDINNIRNQHTNSKISPKQPNNVQEPTQRLIEPQEIQIQENFANNINFNTNHLNINYQPKNDLVNYMIIPIYEENRFQNVQATYPIFIYGNNFQQSYYKYQIPQDNLNIWNNLAYKFN